ncbi:Glycosyltransferase, DXD sugar-binding motif protein [Metarhizium album ARSEF 1941]|uniref:Glycosyltransferase, DXD sugar-binding motif protein n=1 Tax=Metarhizium album (strain ARSEF 1941) TaxID=1081103 RepID=A0A0B2X3F2_METAS|nr:Glycosyltransferase, DXD sugar-binding motif protein [Metarhizium album ARSEF 1941]KHN99835.1 Glycosyltransferase, DXD sugar-binding motif protein [Metarhizium album ARSEF 1941]
MLNLRTPAGPRRVAACVLISASILLTIQTLFGPTWLFSKDTSGAASGRDTWAPGWSSTPQWYRQNSKQHKLVDFPKKVWHIDVGDQVDQEDLSRTATWLEVNPSFRQEYLTGDNAEAFLRDHFPDRPDLVDPYLEVKSPILRADILRHLVLLAKGGVYSDLDVECRRPVTDWIPEKYKDKVNIVVGVEDDIAGHDLNRLASWTIYARRGNPKFERVVLSMYSRLREYAAARGATLATIGTDEARMTWREVISITGPHKFTCSLFEGIGAETNTHCDMTNATDLKEPVLLGDVLVLPVTGFGTGKNDQRDRIDIFVHHNYKSSWLHNLRPEGSDPSPRE